MNVQKMVPFMHSKWFWFELSPSAAVALPDIFTTTLCPLWEFQLSRICQTCTPCKSFSQLTLKHIKVCFKCTQTLALISWQWLYWSVTVCVSGCYVGPVWCRTFQSSHGLITSRVCECTCTQHLFLPVLLGVSQVTDWIFNFQDSVRNQDIIHPCCAVWGSQVASDTVRNLSFFLWSLIKI